MKILLDECVPRAAKAAFSVEGHECTTVPEAGLAGKSNGELLQQAERQFEIFITLDKGFPYQQNLTGYKIAVLVIRAKSSRLADILPHVPTCLAALSSIESGRVMVIGEER